MADDISKTIKQGIAAPSPDICSGWNIRNKSGNANLSALIPIANLYAIMSYDEMADLVRWMQPGSDPSQRGPGRLHGRHRIINYINAGEEDTSSWNAVVQGTDEFNEKISAIQRQLKKDIIFATVTGQNGDAAAVEVGLVRLAEMNSVMKGAYDQDKPYGGVGINSLNGETANQGNLGRRTTISITMSDPNILDLNYAYQKLMTLNTKYIITYGWSNAAGVDSKLGTEAENFAPYPLVETVPQEDGKIRREIEIDLNSTNTGGFWTAQKMALTKFDFNFNEVGQLEGNFTFFDEVAALLSSFTVADIADPVNKIMSSGETTDATGFGNDGAIGDFLGNILAQEVEENQERIFEGNQQYFSPEVDANGNMIVLSGPQQSTDEDTENDSGSVFGDSSPDRSRVMSSEQAMLDNIQNFKDTSFPHSGPGIVQYEIDQRPLVFDTTITDLEDPTGNAEVQETRNVTEVSTRINFYYLGWVLESMRYAMGQQSSAPSRDAYVDNEQQDREEFGLNFYYEPLPENSLFTLQFQRLIESESVGSTPETVAKIMTFIDQEAFPKYNPRIEWEGWGSAGVWGLAAMLTDLDPLAGEALSAYVLKEIGNMPRGLDPGSFINQAHFNQSWSPGMVFSSALQKDLNVEMMARARTWGDEWQNKTPGDKGIGFDSVRFKNMSYLDFKRQTNSTRDNEGGGRRARYSVVDIGMMTNKSNILSKVNSFNEFKKSIDDAGPDKTTVRGDYGEKLGLGTEAAEKGIAVFIRGSIAGCAYLDFNTGATASPKSGSGEALGIEIMAAGGINYYRNDEYNKLIAAMWIPWKEIEQYRRSNSNPDFRHPGPYGMKIDFLRWILAPELFQSTMKKWYLEYKKVLMKELEGVVSRRLNGLKAEGRTYWDILHEPIDILWLTSNRIHQVYEDIAIPNRTPALLMNATGLENFNYSSGAPFPDKDFNWEHGAVGALPEDWRLRTRDYEKRFNYSLFSYFPKIKVSPMAWSPYRKEIPDSYAPSTEALGYPSMNMLKLLWRRRQMNGVKWPRNYVPGPGGMIYDTVTKKAFWPSCQAGRSFDDLDIAYVPENGVLSAQQEELLKLFNVNLVDQAGNQNILEMLSPGYAFAGNIESVDGTEEEFEETMSLKAQIKTLQENVGKRSLVQYMVYRALIPTEINLDLIKAQLDNIKVFEEIMDPFYDHVARKRRPGYVTNVSGAYRADIWGTETTTQEWWDTMLLNETFSEERDSAWAARDLARKTANMSLAEEGTESDYTSDVAAIEQRAYYYDLFMQGLYFGMDEGVPRDVIKGPFIDEYNKVKGFGDNAEYINLQERIPFTYDQLWFAFTSNFTAGTKDQVELASVWVDDDGNAIDIPQDAYTAANKPWAMRIIKDSRAMVDGKLIPQVLVPTITKRTVVVTRENQQEYIVGEANVVEVYVAEQDDYRGRDYVKIIDRDQYGDLLEDQLYVGDEYKDLVENQDLKDWWMAQRGLYNTGDSDYFDVSKGPGLTGQAAKDFLDKAMRSSVWASETEYENLVNLRELTYRDESTAETNWRTETGGIIFEVFGNFERSGFPYAVSSSIGHGITPGAAVSFNEWCVYQNSADMRLIKELHSQIMPPIIYGMPEDNETKKLAMGIISDYFARYRGSNLSYVSDYDLGPYSKENLPPVYFAIVADMEGLDYVFRTTALRPSAAEIDTIHNAEGGPAERFKVLYYNFPAGRRLDEDEINYFKNGAQGDPNEVDYDDLVQAQEAHYPMRHGHLQLHENVCDPGLTTDERQAMVWDVTASRMEIQNDRWPGGYQTAFARAIQMVSLGMNLWPTQLLGGQLDGHRLSKRIPWSGGELPEIPGNLGGNFGEHRGLQNRKGTENRPATWSAEQNHLTPDDIITAKQLIQDHPDHIRGTNAIDVLGLEYVDNDGSDNGTPGGAPWRRGLKSEFTNEGYGYQVSFYNGMPFAAGFSWGAIFGTVSRNVLEMTNMAGIPAPLRGSYLERAAAGGRQSGRDTDNWIIDQIHPGGIKPGGASNFRGGWVIPPGGLDDDYKWRGSGLARYGPTPVRDVGLGTGHHSEQRLSSVWKWVSSIEGMGHLSSSVEGFEKFLLAHNLEDESDYTPGGTTPAQEGNSPLTLIRPKHNKEFIKYSSNQIFGDVFPGGTKINKKYTSYLLSIMNLGEHNRRIMIKKKDAAGYSKPGRGSGKKVWDRSRQDPTYGDAIGFGQSGKTYGDIGGKVPTSTAEVALRRDVVDNMLRPANHRMNLLEFVTQLTAPTTIASVGGQATIACRNINGVLAVTPLGVEQDGWYEDYASEVIQAFDEGPNFDEYFYDEEARTAENERREEAGESTLHKNEAFYVYYKKQFSLVESINLTAKVDPAMMWANKDSTKWFEGGLNRNFGKFLGWGNVAEEFKKFVARHTQGVGKTYADEDRVEKPPLGAHYSELIKNNDEDIEVDLSLLQKIPPTFIDAFLKKNAKMQSNLMKFYLAEHASDVSSIYKHYMQRVNLTIHGTCNLQGYQKLYLKDLLPGLEGLFQVIKVNQSITPGGFTTSIELAMTWQRPPEETTEEKTEEVAEWEASEEELESLAAG